MMDSNEDYEEEEETLVMAELQGIMESDYLSKLKQAKVLGIGTDRPMLQLDDYTFAGQYQNAMGTCMLFEELPAEELEDINSEEFETDPDGKRPKDLEYRCLTNKKIAFERVFLNKHHQTMAADDTEKPGTSESEGGTVAESENQPTQTKLDEAEKT